LLLSLALAACAFKPEPVSGGQPDVEVGSGDRTDCKTIYGTSFRSDAERDWFSSNCTEWPYFNPTPTPQAQGAASIANYLPTQTCDQIRGKPYTSEGQHQWYLANCLGTSQPGPTQVTVQPTPGQSQVVTGPDRTNCDEIRGTPYRSPNERQWYLGNCAAPAPPVQGPGPVASIPLPGPQGLQPVALQPVVGPAPGTGR